MTADGPFRRGEVVWGLGPFKELEEDDPDPERPFLVLSNKTHPFASQQFAGVAISTTERDVAYTLAPEDWYVGGLPEQSFVHPWSLVTRDHADIVAVYGRLKLDTVDEVLEQLIGYLSAQK